MASSIASPIYLDEGDLVEELEIQALKENAVNKLGILCNLCLSVFANKTDFDCHYPQHGTGTAELLYTCVLCKKQMYNYNNFQRHCYLNHVAENTFQCVYCYVKFDTLNILNSHISAIHEYKCDSCTDKFTVKENLEAHKKVAHGNATLVENELVKPKQTSIEQIGGILCHICNTIFGNKKEFDIHYVQHNTSVADIVYTCVVCKKQNSNYSSFRNHCYLVHVAKDKFQCQYCPKSFKKLSIFNNHISTIHDHRCPSCNKKFTFKRDLEIHNKIFHNKDNGKGKNKPPYDCILCDTGIKTVDACQSHVDDHCKTLYPCPICKEVLPNRPAAVTHLMTHFDEKIPNNISTEPSYGVDSSIDILGGILCIHCNTLCRNRADIDTHFKDEHSGKPVMYTCNVCRNPYDKYDVFGNHCYDHFARGKFKCEECDKSFSRLSLLVIHTEAFHTDCAPDKPYGCQRCGRGYMTSLRLQEHLRVAHSEGGSRSRCMKPGCSALFDKPRDLITHLKNHNPMMDNWCKQCGLQFTTFASAEKHLDEHRDTQYACPVCPRTYREKYYMVKHVPSHFEAVLHICKVCGKGYNARNRLIHHLKSHCETRNHKCTYCSKSFAKPFELEQHLNTHTGRRPYPCTLCSKFFTNYPNWSKHLNKVHLVDKSKIKLLHVHLKTEAGDVAGGTRMEKTSPTKPESGIESAGSELSDVHNLMDSDDSDWSVQNIDKTSKNKRKVRTNGKTVSISDSVKAAIDRIDYLNENLDWAAGEMEDTEFAAKYEESSEFNAEIAAPEGMDDENVIKEIVDHIDAMSKDMVVGNQGEAADGGSELGEADPGILHYADMTPVDNTIFNAVPEAMQTSARFPAGPAEYGPDLSESLTSLDDLALPHIDPLLTIRPENNAKMYVQDPHSYSYLIAPAQAAWPPPIITKVCNYDETTDVNNMYIY